MEFIINDKAKKALNKLIENSGEEYVRIKVFYGCGKPAYDLYMDYKKDNDIEVNINEIKFVVDKNEEKACKKLEIKYDKEIYNKGFYIKDNDY